MEYKKRKKAILLLSDGTIFYGKSVFGEGTAFGEVCFNTGMTGYQEIYTDPSYFGQLMIMTNPHIGNYGVVNDESESDSVKISGLICKNFSYNYSRELADSSLEEFLNNNNLFAISDIDTRALVSYIRDNGAMNAVITTDLDDIDSLSKKLTDVPSMEGLELASKVSTKSTYYYGNESSKYKVAALDLGIKKNILRNLAKRDVYVKVFPFNTSFDEMKEWNPDGYFLSNGPGDPEPLKSAQEVAKKNY
jgi:carbamoyl-phosphate synthase small subunit